MAPEYPEKWSFRLMRALAARTPAHGSCEALLAALEREQHLLALETACVAAEPARRVQNPMAGHDDRDRVGAEGVAGGTGASRAPGLRGDLLVGRHRPERDPGGGLQHALAEAADETPIKRELEAAPCPGEVLVELTAVIVELAGSREHPRR